jgi:hypothetical protein
MTPFFFTLGLLFYPENGGIMFFKNGIVLLGYTRHIPEVSGIIVTAM